MRTVRNQGNRVRYYCSSRAQGLNCPGKGSFLDVYEAQVIADLGRFELPAGWKRFVLDAAAERQPGHVDVEGQRTRLQGRLSRLKELYIWGDVAREEYQRERRAIEEELANLAPPEPGEDRLDRISAYLERLPAAWADADYAQRNQLANIVYEELGVDGPRVEYVKPRPEMEPLFQIRAGAAQPTLMDAADCHTGVSSSDPDGIRTHDLHRDRVACLTATPRGQRYARGAETRVS
jgi:hypothetical protein